MGLCLTNERGDGIIYAQQGRFFRQFFTSESRRTLNQRKTIVANSPSERYDTERSFPGFS